MPPASHSTLVRCLGRVWMAALSTENFWKVLGRAVLWKRHRFYLWPNLFSHNTQWDWRLCQVSHWWLATVMWSAIQPSVRLHALCTLSQMLHRVSKIWGTCDKWKLTFSPNFLAYINRKHCIKAATRYFHSCWFWQPLWIKVEWAPPPLVAKILARCATVLEVTECKMQHIYYTIFLFLKERFTNKCQFSPYLPPAIPMEKQVKFSSPLNIPGTVL